MERISRLGAFVVTIVAICFLRSGIIGHTRSGSPEIAAPNNYFIGLGSLLLGMGVVMTIIAIKIRSKLKDERIVTIT